jgi:uncharacterized membrane protein YhaH (DUF805 family)
MVYRNHSFIVSIVLLILESVGNLPSVLSGLYTLAILLPSLAVTVRRLHDTGRSAWWLLIGFMDQILKFNFFCGRIIQVSTRIVIRDH